MSEAMKPVKNTTEVAHAVAKANGLHNKQAEKIVADVFKAIAQSLPHTGRVSIADFGNFVVRTRGARKGHNPKTKAEVQIPASKAVIFRVAQSLKDTVNGRASKPKAVAAAKPAAAKAPAAK